MRFSYPPSGAQDQALAVVQRWAKDAEQEARITELLSGSDGEYTPQAQAVLDACNHDKGGIASPLAIATLLILTKPAFANRVLALERKKVVPGEGTTKGEWAR